MSAIVSSQRAQRFNWHWNTIGRISAGLICLSVALLMLIALWWGAPLEGFGENRRDAALREAIAQAALPLIERGDREALQAQLDRAIASDRDLGLRAIAIRRADGVLFAYARTRQQSPEAGASSAPWDVVDVAGPSGRWGAIEFQSHPSAFDGVRATTRWVLIGVAGLATIFVGYYAYLRRALAHLDPTAVIPERVRQAFDVLTQGVLFVDAQSRIVLANAAFRRLCAAHEKTLTGRSLEAFDWLTSGGRTPIWTRVMRLGEPIRDESYRLPLDNGDARHLLVHGAPVLDTANKVRGCLLTFDDVTELERATAELRQTMQALEASQAKIEEQNVRLQALASRDAFTDCLNRRALREGAEAVFALAARNGSKVSCVMIDIDHFKAINDQHGHSTGDEVIRRVARIASARARTADLLCRYRGEEFCLLLPETTAESAIAIAGLLRATIERECGAAVKPGLKVTASFGVADTRTGAVALDALVEQADQALYVAKRSGRNRVEVFRTAA